MSAVAVNIPSSTPKAGADGAAWVDAKLLRAAFAPGRAGSKRYRYFLRTRCDGARQVLPNERFPDGGPGAGLTVGEFLRQRKWAAVPAELREGLHTMKRRIVRGKHVAAQVLYLRDQEFQREHRHLAPTTRQYAEAFFAVHGPWARANGLGTSLSSLLRYRESIESDQAVDRRYRSGRKPKARDERMVETAVAYLLDPNKFDRPTTLEEQGRIAKTIGAEPLTEWQVRCIDRELPFGAKTLAREGQHAFEMRCVPKTTLDYSGYEPGEWPGCDGRIIDGQERVPDGQGGWKLTRPTAAVMCCNRSTYLVVELGETENADLILRALRRWVVEVGVPRKLTRDNGKAYRRAFAKLDGVCAELRIDLHVPPPRTPWAKKIESIMRLVKRHFDKFLVAFWGGNPQERSHVAKELPIEAHPTHAQMAEWLQLAIDTYNSTPRRSLGGLSPRQVFERRTIDRRMSVEDARLVCRPVEMRKGAPRLFKCGRDGLNFRGMVFEPQPIELLGHLQGKRVLIRPDIDQVGLIGLVDPESGRWLCEAVSKRAVIAGLTTQEGRHAAQNRARYRRHQKGYLEGRRQALEDHEGAIFRARSDYARSEEAERNKRLPPVPPPETTIVAPRLERGKPFQVLAAQAATKPLSRRRSVFAQVADDGGGGLEQSAPKQTKVDFSRFADEGSTDAAELQQSPWRRIADAG